MGDKGYRCMVKEEGKDEAVIERKKRRAMLCGKKDAKDILKTEREKSSSVRGQEGYAA